MSLSGLAVGLVETLGPLLQERLTAWIPLLLSLTVHEYAHARAAAHLGDTTAEAEGRLTLDPIAHIDLLGTVVLPLLGLPIGWARPVPVNPARFAGGGDGRLGMLFTAVAGPLSNLAIALGCGATLAVLGAFGGAGALGRLLASVLVLNVALALFNLLPVPPLDGSRVVDYLLPSALRGPWEWLQGRSALGMALLLILVQLLGFDVGAPARALSAALLGLVGGTT